MKCVYWSDERSYRLDGTPYTRLTLRIGEEKEIFASWQRPLEAIDIDKVRSLVEDFSAKGYEIYMPRVN
jgi:hypothetical protein